MQTKSIQHPIVEISGENAHALESLPLGWQKMANGSEEYAVPSADHLVKMAQLFSYNMATNPAKEFGSLSKETLSFYADDYKKSAYPDIEKIKLGLDSNEEHYSLRLKFIAIAKDLFSEFGYSFPASFYWKYLSPVFRSHPFEKVYLRKREDYRKNARSWDAILHAQKVFPIQMRIQSISSNYGIVWNHGCGCSDCGHSTHKAGKFEYVIESSEKSEAIRAFVWTMLFEHAIFPVTPDANFVMMGA